MLFNSKKRKPILLSNSTIVAIEHFQKVVKYIFEKKQVSIIHAEIIFRDLETKNKQSQRVVFEALITAIEKSIELKVTFMVTKIGIDWNIGLNGKTIVFIGSSDVNFEIELQDESIVVSDDMYSTGVLEEITKLL